MNSPFKCGGEVQRFLPQTITDRLVIRVENSPGAKVHVSVDGVPSDSTASFYLMAGEPLEIRKMQADNASRVAVINVAGDPLIYWFVR